MGPLDNTSPNGGDANSSQGLSCPYRLKLLQRRLFIRRHMPGLSTSAFLTKSLHATRVPPPSSKQGYCDTARERTWKTGEIASVAIRQAKWPRHSRRGLERACYTNRATQKGSPFLKISMKARLDPLGSGSSAMQTTAADAECSSALTDCE